MLDSPHRWGRCRKAQRGADDSGRSAGRWTSETALWGDKTRHEDDSMAVGKGDKSFSQEWADAGRGKAMEGLVETESRDKIGGEGV